jgi:hypothetical protein
VTRTKDAALAISCRLDAASNGNCTLIKIDNDIDTNIATYTYHE